MKQTFKKIVLGIGLASVVTIAQATPIQWTLNNVVFSDQSIATGSFVFDASTGIYTNVLITTGVASYDTSELDPIPFNLDANGIELVDNYALNNNVGKSILNFDFLTALTDAAGTVGLQIGFPSFEGVCTAADCGVGNVSRVVESGEVIGASIPEPASIALLGIGLAGLGAMRRRKSIEA